MKTPTDFKEVWEALEWIANSHQNEQARVARIVLEARSRLDEELDNLEKDSRWLSALEAAGVDNWCGFDEAREILNEWDQE